MKWPWVSRRALDLLTAERDRLLEQVNAFRNEREKWTDHLTRMDRREHGLSETPRPARPDPTPMPEKLKKRITGWGSPTVQREYQTRALRMYASGESWEAIDRIFEEELNGPAPAAPSTTAT